MAVSRSNVWEVGVGIGLGVTKGLFHSLANPIQLLLGGGI